MTFKLVVFFLVFNLLLAVECLLEKCSTRAAKLKHKMSTHDNIMTQREIFHTQVKSRAAIASALSVSVWTGILNRHIGVASAAAGSMKSSPVNEGAIGYEAAESAYAPLRKLYSTPLFPQSALLNTLPLNNTLIGQLQGYLESYTLLINPTDDQKRQLANNDSQLWMNLRLNAQRVAGIFVYNQKQLQSYLDSDDTSVQLQAIRKQLAIQNIEEFRQHSIRLVQVSQRSQIGASLRCVRDALNCLHYLAYLKVPLLLPSSSINAGMNISLKAMEDANENLENQVRTIPRLGGRAIVTLTFQRPGPANAQLLIKANAKAKSITVAPKNESSAPLSKQSLTLFPIEGSNNGPASSQVKLIVDGINHPLAAGNFIDLCLKGFYDNLPVSLQDLSVGNQSVATMKLLGNYEDGYLDPVTRVRRRIPVEVLREDTNRQRYTVTGATQNTFAFTRATPVQSFATYGAVGMYHEPGDANGASSNIFWLSTDRNKSTSVLKNQPWLKKLDDKYSIFAYVIEGNDILEQLQPGDFIAETTVEEGVWSLIQPRLQ